MKFKKLLAIAEDGIRFGFLDPKDNLYHCLTRSVIEAKYSHLLESKVVRLGFELWVPKNQGIIVPCHEGGIECHTGYVSDEPYFGCVSVTFKEPKK